MDLIEREQQLAQLETWLREAANGQGRLVFLGGDGGVGKTALVERFCELAGSRARPLRGACDALGTPRPLGPLVDVAIAIGGPLDELLQTEAARDRIFAAALRELDGGPLPSLLVIEDAHWADDATLDLLRFLGRRCGQLHTLILVTFRQEEVGPQHPLRVLLGDLSTSEAVRRLSLSPLSLGGLKLLTERAGADDGIDVAALHQMTGGNPFFATEVLAIGGLRPGEIPPTVRDAVLARAARLPARGRELLDQASTLGPAFGIGLLEQAFSPDPEVIEQCLEHGMLIEAGRGTLAFRHQFARDAIYGAISAPRRRRLHGQVLDAIRSETPLPDDLPALARHAELSGDEPAARAYAPAAAQRAAALGAHREAAAHYARALAVADPRAPVQRAELMQAYGLERYLIGELEEALELLIGAEEIWAAAGEVLRQADAQRWISRVHWYLGRNQQAHEAARQALSLLEGAGPSRTHALALSNRSQLHMIEGDYEPAVAFGTAAIEMAEQLGDFDVLAHALNNVGAARLLVDDFSGIAELQRSLAIAREHGFHEHVSRAYTNLASKFLERRDLAEAERLYNEGIAYSEEHDLSAASHYMLVTRGRGYLYLGEWDAAARDAGTVLSAPRAAPVSRVAALAVLGLVRARRGDPEPEAPLAEALQFAASTGELQRLIPVRIAMAETAWLRGASKQAASELLALLAASVERRSNFMVGDLLIWLARLGALDGDDWRVHLDRVPEPHRWELLGERTQAADAYEVRGCRYDAAVVLVGGDEAQVRRALEMFNRLGARPGIAIAAQRLRDLGATQIPRGPRRATRANPAGLTAREAEVLTLLASGLTNAEIADRLFLSTKTAEHHVSRILAKLGVAQRRDAARAARDLGLLAPGTQDR